MIARERKMKRENHGERERERERVLLMSKRAKEVNIKKRLRKNLKEEKDV